MRTYAKMRDTCLRRILLSDAIARVDTLSEGRQTRRGWTGGRGEHRGLIYKTRGAASLMLRRILLSFRALMALM